MKTLNPQLSDHLIDLLPSDEDVAFYEEHGWYISKKVLSEEIIDRAILGSQKFYLGERDGSLPYNRGYSNWQLGDEVPIRNNEYTFFQKKEMKNLILQPIIGAIAARLTRSREIRLFQDQLISKQPESNQKGGVIGWHTDHSYVSNSTSDRLLAAWVPFQDCSEENGTLVAIDGSHKWQGNEHMRCFNHNNNQEIEEKFIQEGKDFIKVPFNLKKGQLSFHHGLLIHGSCPNYSNAPRLALIMHLQDESNRYQPFWNQGKEIHHFVDSICQKLPNGYPDYSDPNIFPVLWSE